MGIARKGILRGGNMYRGLYNIVIKSIGAARKKDPATRLDYVIDFGERIQVARVVRKIYPLLRFRRASHPVRAARSCNKPCQQRERVIDHAARNNSDIPSG